MSEPTAPAPRHGAPQPPPLRELPWQARINASTLSLLGFIILALASLGVLGGSGRSLDTWGNFTRFIGRFFPPDLSVVDDALAAIGETVQIATMATLFSIVLSLPLAAAGARTLAPRGLVLVVRMTMNAIRTIPSLVWALIAVAIVGANPLAGVIALTFYSMGYLGKFFSDAFESVDLTTERALRATGTSRIQSFQYGLWPNVRPLVWSYALWMLEYNIRSAAIIGFVGAGGIGLQLHTYQEYYQWDRFATVLLMILILVSLLDFVGERVRRQITRKPLGD
jgi:phosphonate transport system permease protein